MEKYFEGGYQEPLFIIKLNDAEVERFELMLTGAEGLVKSHDDDTSTHKRMSGKISTKKKGFYTKYILSYVDYSPLENQIKIKKIWNYYNDEEYNYSIYLCPRKDTPVDCQEVIFTKGFDEGIMRGGENAPGNRLVKLELQTVNRQHQLMIIDPNVSNFVALCDYAII